MYDDIDYTERAHWVFTSLVQTQAKKHNQTQQTNKQIMEWKHEASEQNLVPKKSFGTGIGKKLSPKQVLEPISEKIGTGKSLRTSIKNKTLIFVWKI